MQRLKVVMVLLAACVAGACVNRTVNFDELPDGTPLAAWDFTSGLGPGNPAVITTQYTPRGVASFNSAGGGVFLFPEQNTSSPPNAACPFGAGGLLNYGETTTITLSQSTDNIWVTIPSGTGAGRVTVTAFSAGGGVLEAVPSDGPGATTVTGGRRVRVNANNIARVELAGTNYCFDDFTWQDQLY